MEKQSLRTDDCINEIVSKYSDMVLRLAFIYVKNISDAEDITQDVFLKLYRGNKVFNNDEHLKAWLIVVTKNTSKDYIKSLWRRKTEELKDNLSANDNYFDSQLIKEVLKLPVKYRDVLYLYYYEGYSISEIAKNLNINEATIRTRLKRGREALKRKIGGLDELYV
ncbi:sigma-70 family RNA polymerase sigma factor [Clostridium sediminicola]|uniref:RNA polymerase sigma factor n=1 Tax=Clostridium sediminicola TaxID=3114879 RepID=UPI0031F266E5